METIYGIFQQNQNYYVWISVIISALYSAFLYFYRERRNKERDVMLQNHSVEMERLKHSFDLELHKRKAMYEMKASQFEKYYRMADELEKANNVEMPARLNILYKEFMEAALSDDNNEISAKVIAEFGFGIGNLMNEASKGYHSFKAETNSLKLIASDALSEIFDKVISAYEKSFNTATEFIGKFVEITTTNNIAMQEEFKLRLESCADETKTYLQQLMTQMRKELNEI